jgi:hypothetical protein
MQITSPQQALLQPKAPAAVLALARRLHRDARSDSLALSLPILRRLIASQTLRDLTLPQLHRRRNMIQRKHILRALALEAGFTSWEDYRHALCALGVAELPHFDLAHSQAGYPNLWFSSRAQAISHSLAHGGRVMSVGTQAVVLSD